MLFWQNESHRKAIVFNDNANFGKIKEHGPLVEGE